jgi:hypothetical protein
MAIVQRGESWDFGVNGGTDGGLVATQSVQVTTKREKKEGKNNKGEVVALVYMNETTEITIEGIGESGTIGTALNIQTFDFSGNAYVEEFTKTATNEDFVKTSIKAVAYENIN